MFCAAFHPSKLHLTHPAVTSLEPRNWTLHGLPHQPRSWFLEGGGSVRQLCAPQLEEASFVNIYNGVVGTTSSLRAARSRVQAHLACKTFGDGLWFGVIRLMSGGYVAFRVRHSGHPESRYYPKSTLTSGRLCWSGRHGATTTTY